MLPELVVDRFGGEEAVRDDPGHTDHAGVGIKGTEAHNEVAGGSGQGARIEAFPQASKKCARCEVAAHDQHAGVDHGNDRGHNLTDANPCLVGEPKRIGIALLEKPSDVTSRPGRRSTVTEPYAYSASSPAMRMWPISPAPPSMPWYTDPLMTSPDPIPVDTLTRQTEVLVEKF